MSALEAIKLYGGGSESSEDEFCGFDPNKSEQYPEVSRSATLFLNRPNMEEGQAIGQIDDDETVGDNNNPLKDAVSVTGESIDSEGSYFAEQRRKKRRRTKKEQRKAAVEKKRRTSHPPKLVPCGCRKGCPDNVSKDDRSLIHRAFWKLNMAGQTAFFRERVDRVSVKKKYTPSRSEGTS